MSLKHPSTCIVCGPSQSGKSYLVRQMIHRNVYEKPLKRILWCYSLFQPWFVDENSISFKCGLPDNYDNWDLVIIDDLMHSLNEKIGELFTVLSHHKSISVILILQNLFLQNRIMRDISLNTHYLILFKNNRDESQINCLGRQAFIGRLPYFKAAYTDATSKPYGHLLIDFHPLTDKKLCLRDSCFPDERGIYWVYVPQK